MTKIYHKVYNPQWGGDMLVTGDLMSKMTKAGFEPWHTGGGCMAWGKTLNDREYLMITSDVELGDRDADLSDQMDAVVFVEAHDYLVGRYHSDPDSGDEGWFCYQSTNAAAAIKAADRLPKPDLTDDYTLDERGLVLSEMQTLAQAARPLNDEEDGSERQIDAENAFFARVEEILPPEVDAALSRYCLKATTDERLDEAMVQIRLNLINP